jgi:hypothetical protein
LVNIAIVGLIRIVNVWLIMYSKKVDVVICVFVYDFAGCEGDVLVGCVFLGFAFLRDCFLRLLFAIAVKICALEGRTLAMSGGKGRILV